MSFLHRLFLRPREEVRGLRDAAALERDGAADVEPAHFQRSIPQHARPRQRDRRPLLPRIELTEAAVRDAVEQGQHGRLLELVLGAPAQVGKELGVPPGIGQLLRRMERRQRPAQLGREGGIPLLPGETADCPFGSELGEDGRRRPRGCLGVGVPSHAAEHDGEVPHRVSHLLRPLVLFRPSDHLTQRPLGGRQLVLGRQHRRRDPQILGLSDRVRQAAPDLPNSIELAPSPLEVAAREADLRPPPERLGLERVVSGRFGLRDGPVGLRQRPVERPLLPIRDRQVVVALGDALTQTGALEGGDGDLP